MSLLMSILFLVIGLVIGFFVARYWFQEHSEQARLNDEVMASKQQLANYQREVSEHFATAAALVEQLSETQQKLQNYLHHSADLLQQSGQQTDLPFFAEDTIRQLRVANAVKSDVRKAEDSDSPPRDYPDAASGLFKGENNKRNKSNRTPAE